VQVLKKNGKLHWIPLETAVALEIAPCAKGAPTAGNEDNPDSSIPVGSAEFSFQDLDRFPVERVEFPGPIQVDKGDSGPVHS
jgi:hypothetical protein